MTTATRPENTIRKKTGASLGRKDQGNAVFREDSDVAAISDFLLHVCSDFQLYAPEFLKIQTKDGKVVPFSFNSVQSIMEDVIDDIKTKGRLVRIVVLKARREGISTWVSGRFFWKTTTAPNRYAMIVTHEPEATDFIFKMHKRFQENIPEWFRPTERYNNKKMLEFNTEKGDGLDSAIRVGTAGKEDLGSSQLIHYLHFSEVAKYPKHTATALMTSILQCVPSYHDTEVLFESTAKGVGGEFYDRFWTCRYRLEFYLEDGKVKWKEVINEEASEDSEYTAIFIPWFVFDEYQRDLAPKFILTEDEITLKALHGLTDRHISWRRWCIANNCNNDIEVFNQEYPSDSMSAFLSKADNVFPADLIMKKIKLAKPPKVKYKVQIASGNWIIDDSQKKEHDNTLQVWKEPVPSNTYLLSGDPAEGISTGDFSSLDVLDIATGEQVAHWHGHIPPDHFGSLAVWVAKRYNNAMIGIERNNHGQTTLTRIQDYGYPNVYFELVTDPPARPRKRYGWLTTRSNKPLIIDMLAAEVRDLVDGINCKETLEELLVFKQHEDGSLGAESGRHDDRVISLAIGKYLRTKSPRLKRKTLATSSAYYYNTNRNAQLKSITKASWA